MSRGRRWARVAAALLSAGLAVPWSVAAQSPGGAPEAKRVAPRTVAPVVVDGLRIVAVPWSRERGFAQNGGVIEAFDAAGRSLWLLKVYDTAYRPDLEWDVQDVFITRLRRAGPHRVRVDDERGRHWLVDVATRTVGPG